MENYAIRPDPLTILIEREMRSLAAMKKVREEIKLAKRQFGDWINISSSQRTLWATQLRHHGWVHDPQTGWFLANNSVTLSSF